MCFCRPLLVITVHASVEISVQPPPPRMTRRGSCKPPSRLRELAMQRQG